MFAFLWLIPALPLAGFVILAFAGGRLSRAGAAVIGVGSVGVSAALAILTGAEFLVSLPAGYAYSQHLWTWIDVAGFTPEISFYLDALSLVMILVVTVVGFLIHLYSAEFMAESYGYSRFFAYMNLFVASMLTLVMAENLLLLYLGWEGVGLCSYLLIGFWYKDPVNGKAAIKAFVVTRIGDTSMAVGLLLLFANLGTLQIQEVLQRAAAQWPVGSALAVAASALLLGGALGKSAQLPLQTWLPDAMAGPTPVSALIHAATMVTAGVYLIARTHTLFMLAPSVQLIVAIIGAVTLVIAAVSALVQWDIKRVLAYSTISQIGYMFLALGVGAWSAAIFHFMTHAFFKALLFLAAGVVIAGLKEEHNMLRMGGLRRQLPLAFWTFLIGAASLSALPLVTAGYYSKDMIILQSWISEKGSPWFWVLSTAGALLTGMYAFRMVFLTFFGEAKQQVSKLPGISMKIPLVILAVLSVTGGFLELPRTFGHLTLFSDLTQTALPAAMTASAGVPGEALLQVITSIVALLGIFLAYLLFFVRPDYAESLARSATGSLLHAFWFAGWGFDWLYHTLFVRPFLWIARVNREDFTDLIYRAVARCTKAGAGLLTPTESGKVRWYATGIAMGAVITLGIVIFSR